MCRICDKHEEYKKAKNKLRLITGGPYIIVECPRIPYWKSKEVYISTPIDGSAYDFVVHSKSDRPRLPEVCQYIHSKNVTSKDDLIIIEEHIMPAESHYGFVLRRV